MNMEKSSSNQTKVALNMTKHLFSKRDDENIMFSPLSIHVVLSIMAAAFSMGPTLDEMLSFLHSKSTDEINSNASKLHDILSDGFQFGGPRLCFAFGMWIDQSLSLKPSFQHLVHTNYKAALASVDFHTKPDEVRNQINSWVEENTNDIMKGFLPPGLVRSSTKLMYANAIYFKGMWDQKFNESKTKKYDFHLLNGTIVKVPFMTNMDSQFVRAFNGFKVLRLPYEQGEDKRCFSMYLFLPDAKDGLPTLVEKVCSKTGFLERHLPSERVLVGDFRIPKFKISYEFDASKVLNEMGLVLPFTNGDLTEMVDSFLGANVISIFQKSFIEVNEEGTKATVATRVQLACTASRFSRPRPPIRIDFVADHSFLFFIQEDKTETILFIGQMLNPLAG